MGDQQAFLQVFDASKSRDERLGILADTGDDLLQSSDRAIARSRALLRRTEAMVAADDFAAQARKSTLMPDKDGLDVISALAERQRQKENRKRDRPAPGAA